jgi:hypothetical protein
MLAISNPARLQSHPQTDQLGDHQERPLARIRVTARDADFHLYCDSIAYDEQSGIDHLMVLSTIGPQTSIKALAALLQSDVRCAIRTEGIDGWYGSLGKHPNGYTIHRHRFEHNTWHVLAVAKQDGLLLTLSDESLWIELRKPRFTTPLLREWVPWLMTRLEAGGHLRRLKCYGCESAVLTASDDELDEAVASELRAGTLKIR